MINLTKMELFRFFKSKTTYITLLFAIILSFILFAMSAAFGEQSEAGTLEENNVMYTEISDSEAADIKNGSAGVGFVAADFTSDTKATLEFLIENFISSGVYLILVGVFATNVVCSKYKYGFQKNLNIYSQKKWQMVVAENVSILFFSAIAVTLIALTHLFISALYFKDFSIGNLVNIIRYWGMQILLHYAFAVLIMCVAEIIRSKIVCIVFTCMLSLGFGLAFMNSIDSKLGLEKFSFNKCMIEYHVKLVPIKFDSELWINAIIVALLATVVYNIINAVIVSRRDMA